MRERTAKAVLCSPALCDAEIAATVMGGAWKPTLLVTLHEHGSVRFGALGRLVGDPTPRVLTRQLRELEADGMVVRTVYAQVPPKVEYSLTPLGEGSIPLLRMLAQWGADYAAPHRDDAAGRDAPAH